MSPSRFLPIAILLSSAAQLGLGQPSEPEERPLGAPAEIAPAETELIRVEPGSRLRGQPDVRSQVIAVVDAAIELEILERRDPWVRVLYGSSKGWLTTAEDVIASADDALASDRAAWRLALARQMLGYTSISRDSSRRGPKRLGSFELLTDVRDRSLLRFLGAIAVQLPRAYRDRYRLGPRIGAPSADSSDTVILFAHERDYRAYEAEIRPRADRGALGHAYQGLAVLYVGRQSPDDVAAVLVHELTHVLNRRALNAAPPWLEEGMANDLAFCRIGASRGLELGSLGGRNVVIEQHSYRPGGWLGIDQAIHLSGPLASFSLLRDRWLAGETLSLVRLASMRASEFFDPESRQAHYDASAFFLRYLLDGEDDLTAPFHAFLASLAAERRAEDPPALDSALGRTWPELERDFGGWLEQQKPRP
ncbi:MAG: hypothetical protein GY719_05370 [bacterium]|nr:hypothetical protein [bacterium]